MGILVGAIQRLPSVHSRTLVERPKIGRPVGRRRGTGCGSRGKRVGLDRKVVTIRYNRTRRVVCRENGERARGQPGVDREDRLTRVAARLGLTTTTRHVRHVRERGGQEIALTTTGLVEAGVSRAYVTV